MNNNDQPEKDLAYYKSENQKLKSLLSEKTTALNKEKIRNKSLMFELQQLRSKVDTKRKSTAEDVVAQERIRRNNERLHELLKKGRSLSDASNRKPSFDE